VTNQYYTYVIKHNDTPIWVGAGTGSRHEIKGHYYPSATPIEKCDYILLHLAEITSEIVLANTSMEEALQKEKELILKYGFRGAGGTLFNRTYGGERPGESCRAAEIRSPISLIETAAKRKAENEAALLAWMKKAQ
jgi:hypothetical protein